MTPRPARPAALLLLLALALAACQPSASASPSPSAAPSEEPSEPGPSESAAALCDPGVICNGPLIAGDYVSETTGARVEFTLDEHDWFGQEDTPGDGFSLFLADVEEGAISVVSFSGEVFTNSCDASSDPLQLEATPAAFMNMLTTRTGITATTPEEVEVGGRPALQTDLTVDLAECSPDSPTAYLWTLPVHGDFHFNDQEQARVMAVNAESATVIIVAEALPGVDWDHFLEHFTELVETMTITPL